MRFLLFCVLLPLAAQTPAVNQQAIQQAQRILVSTLDSELPSQPLLQWLTQVFSQTGGPGAKIDWEITDCGEQTGNPDLDRGRDFPLCVDAVALLSGGRLVIVTVVMGTFQRGIAGMPGLWSVNVKNGGRFESVAKLRDLPARILALN